MSKRFTVELNISAEQWSTLYRDYKQYVECFANGLRILVPVRHFRSLLAHDGIRGRFELTISDENEFISIRRQS